LLERSPRVAGAAERACLGAAEEHALRGHAECDEQRRPAERGGDAVADDEARPAAQRRSARSVRHSRRASATGPKLRLPPPVDRAAYRIAQEAMTNAARHGTGAAELTLECRDGVLTLTVANPVADGATARATGGHGLTGMQERAALLGGALDARR